MSEVKENKMMQMPVGKLMLSTGIPMIISMMLQAVYNIVDSAFVSNMSENGEEALNALTLAFPLQVFMIAIGIGTGVGANILVSKSLGMKDKERANHAAGNAIFLAFVMSIIFLIFGLFGVSAYIKSQSSNPVIVQMGIDYLKICCIISFGMSFFSIFEKLLQSTGKSLYSTIAQIAGAVTNIILDPILIYGLFGMPEMKVKGAAYATVIGQIVSFVLALIFHFKVNKDIDKKLCYLKPDLKIIKIIYSIGLPAIISQALISVMTYGLNIIFVGISETMVTAYGLFYKIQQFILFAAFGIRDAIMPITSFSFGMKSRQRLKDSVKFGNLYTAIIMVAGFIIIEIFASPFAKVFGLSGETEALFVSAMRVISFSFVFAGINIAFQGLFQALEGGIQSLVISICRQLLFIFPCAFIFASIIKHNSDLSWTMWLTFPIAELLTALIAVLMFKKLWNKIKGVLS